MRSVGAIILAAGGSTRFGQPKQLLQFRGESLVQRAVRAASEAGCARVVLVVGQSRDGIGAELRESSAELVANADWQRGIGTSIRRGLEHLLKSHSDLDAIVLLACDQPLVEASTIKALIRKHETSAKPIVASSYANTLGIPALFGRSCFASLLTLPDGAGAKAIIESDLARVTGVEFKDGAIDIDTPADFEGLNT